MLPSPDPEHRTGVRQDWPDSVTMDDWVRVRVTFVTSEIQPAPNVFFELDPKLMEGLEFETTRPTVSPQHRPDGSYVLEVPSDPIAGRGEYQTELRFRPTQVGSYVVHVRYRIGDGLPSDFVATGLVAPSARTSSREPVHAWE